MATRIPPPPVKMTVRTAGMTTEFKGSIQAALDHLLISCGDPDQRIAAMEALKVVHERVSKWEQERALK